MLRRFPSRVQIRRRGARARPEPRGQAAPSQAGPAGRPGGRVDFPGKQQRPAARHDRPARPVRPRSAGAGREGHIRRAARGARRAAHHHGQGEPLCEPAGQDQACCRRDDGQIQPLCRDRPA
ncbi:uncharacterized protein COLE_07557 [Cutaneotrichosporon oleaginosum]|uniref:uncharacterized protein n=1 Tax=Cutaneotrichosporon oleaginosum TaxID=879819 RepID=UPI00132B28E3|nr:hypothetical protein COLE_07557 [Cutaneotrichosporon oleaginosum]